jgi:hypothetical protein
VVSERDHVGARRQKLLRELRREARPVGGVLAVDDAEARAKLVLEAGKPSLYGTPAGRTEDVSDEEDPERGAT